MSLSARATALLVRGVVVVWWLAAGSAGALGVLWLGLFASPAAVLLVIVVVAGFDAVLRTGSGRPAVGRFLRSATEVAVVLAACGLVMALHVTGLWIMLLLAGTSPVLLTSIVTRVTRSRPVVQRPRVRLRPRAARHPPVADPAWATLESQVLEGLADDQLCWLWRASFVLVGRASSAEELSRVVLARTAYLDEFERRHPAAFLRWVSRGARAASDPTPYLQPPSRTRDRPVRHPETKDPA